MVQWKYNDNIEVELPELTEEALKRFLEDKPLSFFMSKDDRKKILAKFRQDVKDGKIKKR